MALDRRSGYAKMEHNRLTGDFLVQNKNMSKHLAFLLALTSINLVFAAGELTFATPSYNGVRADKSAVNESAVMIYDGALAAKSSLFSVKSLNSSDPYTIADVGNVTVTGYSSTEAETDDTPFITASGKYVFPGVAASNALPIGTKFRLPYLFGDRIFVVEDRMHSRYNGKKWVDIWFDNQEKAIKFGKRTSQIEILEG